MISLRSLRTASQLILLLLLVASRSEVFGQALKASANDCADISPDQIFDLTTDPVGEGSYSNLSADDSELGFASCLRVDDSGVADVWFELKLSAEVLRVEISPSEGGGDPLNKPQFLLLAGPSCADATQVGCATSVFDEVEAVESFFFDLDPSKVHYLVVSGADGAKGDFDVSIESTAKVSDPIADCATATILCDKTAQTVDRMHGVGKIASESSADDCFGGRESNSAWYKWTVSETGDLAFTLNAEDPSDDLDWILYELNDINDCASKSQITCVVTGRAADARKTDLQGRCVATTGMRPDATNEIEDEFGCPSGATNFAKSVTLEAGRSYALLVNNSDQTSGEGFTLDFEGTTAAFGGGEAPFSVVASGEPTCSEQAFTFQYTGPDVAEGTTFTWTFGKGATRLPATSRGPHTVTYKEEGSPQVTLTLSSSANGGCGGSSTQKLNIEFLEAVALAAPVVTQPTCDSDSNTGSLIFNIDVDDPNTYLYLYLDGLSPLAENDSIASPSFTGLNPGNYRVIVATTSGLCPREYPITIESNGGTVEFSSDDVSFTNPTCQSPTTTLTITTVDAVARSYTLNERPPQVTNTFEGITSGTYSLTVSENGRCDTTLLITIPEATDGPSFGVPQVTTASCGNSDGAISVTASNAIAYQLNGGVEQPEGRFETLPAGNYAITATNAENCGVTLQVEIAEEGNFEVAPAAVDSSSCASASDGIITAAFGEGFVYSLDDADSQSSPSFEGLVADEYTLTTSLGGCSTSQLVVVSAATERTLIASIERPACALSQNGIVELNDLGEGYRYARVDDALGTDRRFENLAPGQYTFTASNSSTGCESTVAATLEPILQAGVRLALGEPIVVQLGLPVMLNIADLTGLGDEYSYSFGGYDSIACADASCRSIVFTPLSTGLLQVSASSQDGCAATGELQIRVRGGRVVFLPTAFSPNGAAPNDVWQPNFSPAVSIVRSLRVFNRWGELVFQQTDVEPTDAALGWNGRDNNNDEPAGSGVYVAVVVVEVAGRSQTTTSDITLLR